MYHPRSNKKRPNFLVSILLQTTTKDCYLAPKTPLLEDPMVNLALPNTLYNY